MMHERAQLFSIEALLSVEKPFLTIIYQTDDDECTESIETASKYIRMALDVRVVCQNRRRWQRLFQVSSHHIRLRSSARLKKRNVLQMTAADLV